MALYAFVTHAVLLVISFIIFRKISNPIVFFNLIWSVLIFISMLDVTGINTASDTVYKMFLLGGLSFNIVGVSLYLVNLLLVKKNDTKKNKKILNDDLKCKLIVAVNVLMLIYYVYKAVVVFRGTVAYGNYDEIRDYYYSNENFSSTFEYITVLYLFDPMLYVDSIFASINLFERKYSKYITALLITNIVLRTVISGGRMILFEFVACVVFAYFSLYLPHIKKTLSHERRKGQFGIVLIMFAALIIAAYITRLRGGQDKSLSQNVISTLVSNFTGSFTFFSILDDYRKYIFDFNLRATFAGIIDPVYMFLRFINLTNSEIAQNSIGDLLSGFYSIGDHYYNAMPTMYYFFVTDFKATLGPIIGPAILAIYSFVTDILRRRRATYKTLAVYMLMMLTLVESPMTWLPFKTSFVIANLFAIILISNDSIKRSNSICKSNHGRGR